MPIVSPILANPLVDGRQSERAMRVRRGVQRLLIEMGASVVPELSLASGRRADLVALTRKGDIWIIEIKSSIEDFRVDRKWPEYRLHSDRFFFATHPDVPADIFPEECGFILSDGYGAEMLREAPEHRLAAATRKALTLRIARAAANRLTMAELAGAALPGAEVDEY
ncbi:MmcB family DNA repair protein [Chelativorans sp. ZYF759]|uniref:MmcB family DNA repair protein n=1 Tax=Chelativorans sp. ZYF759 TaxID=2692213 RepID=UPI00145EF696|nr:MmcB family DNA repair protein [Chelativorans sp. ZYF759]NMG37900.1 MmcB family DNA repair protein [Chelativorans sp. ZYF759]